MLRNFKRNNLNENKLEQNNYKLIYAKQIQNVNFIQEYYTVILIFFNIIPFLCKVQNIVYLWEILLLTILYSKCSRVWYFGVNAEWDLQTGIRYWLSVQKHVTCHVHIIFYFKLRKRNVRLCGPHPYIFIHSAVVFYLTYLIFL